MVSFILIGSCIVNNPEESDRTKVDNVEVSFYTADSIKIYRDFFKVGEEAPTIILFHQARSNALGENASVAKRLQNNGYNVLAIDQRSGGQLYGSYNRTIANFEPNPFV